MARQGKHSARKLKQMITPGTYGRGQAIHDGVANPDKSRIEMKLKENYIQYWSNFFRFNHPGLEKVKQQIIEKLCYNGHAGITYQQSTDSFLVFDVAAYTQRLDLQIEKATLILVVTGNSRTIQNVINDKGAVIISADRNMTPGLIMSDDFIKAVVDGFKSLSINRKNSRKSKLIRVSTVSEGKMEEVDEIYNSDKPYLVVQGDADEVQDMSLPNNEKLIGEDIWNSYQFGFGVEGIRHNSLDKSAEVKEVEAKNDAMTFLAYENQKVQVICDMVERLNKLYGTSIVMETLIEMQERENKEREKENDKSESGQTDES